MSAKWVRSQEWERRHLAGPLTPVRWVLHALSSITLAVVLLSLVAVYGILASVPVGLIALLPTYVLYGVTLLITVAVIAGIPVWGWWRATTSRGFGLRFTVALVLIILLGVAAVWGWNSVAWPVLRYDESKHTGLRLFADFVDRYKAV
ncbi:MAG TPA: hypothetical protein VEB22_05215, partial [Phycisphaerales bacterium]|nr:hypothetical protein [Phycisphaerales bacterium]